MPAYRISRRFAAHLGIAGLLPLVVGLGLPVPQPSPPAFKYDLAAFGATASGKVGDVVTVTVGVTNNGPDTLRRWGNPPSAVYWNVTLPPGTEAVRGIDSPIRIDGVMRFGAVCHGTAGGDDVYKGTKFECRSGETVEGGQSSKGMFYLKITKVIPNATGAVEVDSISGGRPADDDRDPDNNQASFVINPDSTISGKASGLLATRRSEVIAGAIVLLLLITAGWMYLRPRRSSAVGDKANTAATDYDTGEAR